MMTLKHIELSGHEQIHEVSKVWFNPEAVERLEQDNQKTGSGPTPLPRDTLYASIPGEPHPIQISSGTVFVMNQHGKTVSRYDLGASMVGFDKDAHMTFSRSEITAAIFA